jgi:NDP-sugar pyrophosphorylase family protein
VAHPDLAPYQLELAHLGEPRHTRVRSLASPSDTLHPSDAPLVLVVAAGGLGTRLLAPNVTGPKSLVPLIGRPLLAWALEAIMCPTVAAVFVTGPPDALTSLLSIARAFCPCRPIYEVSQPTPSGTLDALARVLHSARSVLPDSLQHAPLAYLLGDNIPSRGALSAALSNLRIDAASFLTRHATISGSSAVVGRDTSGAITSLLKPAVPLPGVEILCGLYVFGPWIWRRRSLGPETDTTPSSTGEWNIDSLTKLVIQHRAYSTLPILGPWVHINTPSDYAQALACPPNVPSIAVDGPIPPARPPPNNSPDCVRTRSRARKQRGSAVSWCAKRGE